MRRNVGLRVKLVSVRYGLLRCAGKRTSLAASSTPVFFQAGVAVGLLSAEDGGRLFWSNSSRVR